MRETGKVDELGTAFSMSGAYPASKSQADKDAAERRFAFANLWFLEPMQNGRYPDAYVGGVDLERLGVEPGDMEIVKAPADFIGINLYTGAEFEHDPQDPNLGVRQARREPGEQQVCHASKAAFSVSLQPNGAALGTRSHPCRAPADQESEHLPFTYALSPNT